MKKLTHVKQLRDKRWAEKQKEIIYLNRCKCTSCEKFGLKSFIRFRRYIDGVMLWEYGKSNYLFLCDECNNKRMKKIGEEMTRANSISLKEIDYSKKVDL